MVTSVTNTTVNSGSTAASASGAAQSGISLAKNFDTFLQLLTTQLKNQDPTSPMDSKEFTQQLVQFSSVEQQINQNKNLEKMITLLMSNQGAGYVSYIGKEVEALGSSSPLKNGAAGWSYDMPAGAYAATLGVYDSTGALVYSTAANKAVGRHQFNWDGKDKDGNAMPDGTYKIQLVAKDDKGKVLDTKTYSRGLVTGVETVDGQQFLTVGSTRLKPEEIVAVRAAG